MNVVVIVLVPCILDANIYARPDCVTTGMASARCSGGGPGELCILVISIRGLLTLDLLRLGNRDVKRVLGFTLNTVTLKVGPLFNRLTSLCRHRVVVLVSIVLARLGEVVVMSLKPCLLDGTVRTPFVGTWLLVISPLHYVLCVRPVP